MSVPRRPSTDAEQVKKHKIPSVPPFELTEKTPKNQVYTITMWNQMRQRLIDLDEMEPE